MKFALKAAAVLCLLYGAIVGITYWTAPLHTTEATHVDTLIVLGYPCEDDGRPSPEQRERVLEAVREFKAGRASHMIMTGAAAHNQWIEAESMARMAEQNGVPSGDLTVEPNARNTIENIYYSNKIMADHGWKSAEVVSSVSHLPRAGLILGHYGFTWRTHSARWPVEYSIGHVVAVYLFEAQQTTRLRWFGFPTNKFLPK